MEKFRFRNKAGFEIDEPKIEYDKKIGIVAESLNQYRIFIHDNFKDEVMINGLSPKYHYININNYECVSGIELESFIFASDKLRDMYHFFKKIESRVL